MDIHGVNEDDRLKRSNMKELHALLLKADKVLNY